MRSFVFVLILICFVCSAEAKDPRKPELNPGNPVEGQLQQHGSYTDAKGEVVHAPSSSVSGGVPDGATAKCGDGTYSFSHSRSGTCSRHGGAVQWLR
jgi:hypothetical protein